MGRDNHPKQRNRVRKEKMLGEEQERLEERGRERRRESKEKGKERSLRRKRRLPWLLFPVLQVKSFALTEPDQMLAE